MVAVAEMGSTVRTRARRCRWRVMVGRSAAGSTPPTTEVPPPKGMTAMPRRAASAEHGRHLLLRLGPDDGVGGMGHLAAADAHSVAIAFAQAVDGPLGGIGGDGVLADGAAQGGQRRAFQARGRQGDGVEGFDARRLAGLAQTAGARRPRSVRGQEGGRSRPPLPIPTISSA